MSEHQDEAAEAVAPDGDGRFNRRSFGRKVVVGAPAVVAGSLLASTFAPESAEAATTTWDLAGNSATAASNFLGTTDSKALILKTANTERMRITPSGSIGIVTTTPQAKFHVRTALEAGRFERTATTGAGTSLKASIASPDATAILAQNTATGSYKGVAVQGLAGTGTVERIHPTGTFWQAAGEFCGLNGVIGAASTEVSDGYGVIGIAENPIGVGVYARGLGGAKALVASGNADVLGTLTKSGGSFRIDHPLDPAGRYLSHSFVESPDMKNVYDGTVVADAAGESTVALPDWFAALNKEFRYQLTPIGGPAPDLHVAQKFDGTSFKIAGAKAGQEISWQLTGIRQDAWANANRIPVETNKPATDKGRFLHPELFGASSNLEVGSRAGLPRAAGRQ